MPALEALVAEWRDAREAILLINWGDPQVAKANTHLWGRLGKAESALMAYARSLSYAQAQIAAARIVEILKPVDIAEPSEPVTRGVPHCRARRIIQIHQGNDGYGYDGGRTGILDQDAH